MEKIQKTNIKVKLVIAMFLLLFAYLTYHTITTSIAYTAKNATIKGNGVRIRKSPVNGSVIAGLNNGHAVKIVNEKKGSDKKVWYNVTFTYSKTSKKGWVRSDLVKIKSTGSTSSTTTINKTGKVKGSGVNVRKSPVSGASIAKVNSGLSVKLTKQTKGSDKKTWYYISFKLNGANKAGWIRSDYITITTSSNSGSSSSGTTTINKSGKVKGSGVNVRKSPVSGASIAKVSSGLSVKLTKQTKGSDKKTWYYISFKLSGANKAGWIRSDYITITTSGSSGSGSSGTDTSFESTLTKQGFPESYKPGLRALHKKYPKWQFQAQKTGLAWNTVIANESKLGVNMVPSSSVTSWKSTQAGAINWDKNTWYGMDGDSWVAASEDIIKYYMDPRNFLDENYVFQFLKQSYNSKEQTASGLQAATKGSFLAGTYTESGKKIKYNDTLMKAGKDSGVSPYALSAMIIIEQGINGTGKSISGTVSGYKGLYNFFNIGAYTTSSMTAIQRGLWFAGGEGKNKVTYSRPWKTRTKSIIGGATHYGANYVKVGQDTLYLKKFNVQGNNKYSHQYMGNVLAGAEEGKKMAKGYTGSAKSAALTFKIPVFNSMPSSACKKPTSNANPDNRLKSLSVTGQKIKPGFSRETLRYELTVEHNVTSIGINASPVNSGAKISGAGKMSLKVGTNTKNIVVTAPNGTKRTYTLTIKRK